MTFIKTNIGNHWNGFEENNRIYEHKNHSIKNSFTDKYNLEFCIYYEEIPYFDLAIKREKELKGWNRAKKEALINKKNPDWKVLVTEKGFVREQQQIPRYTRNDTQRGMDARGSSSGEAVATSSSPQNGERHSERSEESPERLAHLVDGITRYVENDNTTLNDEILRFAQNDSAVWDNKGE